MAALWSLQRRKILIVDDIPEMRSMLRNTLFQFGADNITPAATGEEAIELMGRQTFDLVLCDYNLGEGKDGQQVLEEAKLRNYLPYSSVFIMVTAENTSLMVMGALEYQPDEYLSKPVNRTVLQGRLRKITEKKDALKPLSKALSSGNKQVAVTLCQRYIEAGVKNRYELMKLQVELLIHDLDLVAAKAICGKALLDRDFLWANFSLGKIAYLERNYDDAKRLFECVLSANEAFVSAYDWLAKIYTKQGDTALVQSSLEKAVAWSPKSVVRLRSLAEASEINANFEAAESLRKRVLRIGKNSMMRKSEDFSCLAAVLLQQDKHGEALRTVAQLKQEYKGDVNASLSAALAEEKIFLTTSNLEEAEKAAKLAVELYQSSPEAISNETALQLTALCISKGNDDLAQNIVEQLVNNNHDDQTLLDQVAMVYKDAGREDEITHIVSVARKEMISVNNQGVKLLEQGALFESIALFEKAMLLAPHNQVLNINTAQAYIMAMKKHGSCREQLASTRACLDFAHDNPDLAERYKVLNNAYWAIASSTGQKKNA